MLDNPTMARQVTAAIKEACRRLNVTQTQLAAEYFGITPQALIGWKKTGKISKSNVATLSEVSQFPLEYFYGESTETTGSGIAEPKATYHNKTAQQLSDILEHLEPRDIEILVSLAKRLVSDGHR